MMQSDQEGNRNHETWSDTQLLLNCLNKAALDIEEQTTRLKNANEVMKNNQDILDMSAFGTACGDVMNLWSKMLGVHQILFQEMVNLSKPAQDSKEIDLRSGYSMMVARIGDADNSVREVISTIRDTTQMDRRSNGQNDRAGTLKRTQPQSNTPKKRKIDVDSAISVPVAMEYGTSMAESHEGSGESVASLASRKMRKARGKRPSSVDNESRNMAPPAVPVGKQQRKNSFEDITADVAAAVKAKEEKRRLRKESRKRKRDSIASSILDRSDNELDLPTRFAMSGNEATSMPSKKKDQPPKKKTKLQADEVAPKGNMNSNRRVKRRRSTARVEKLGETTTYSFTSGKESEEIF